MKRKVRRYAEGGLGYEEDPTPGSQSDKKSSGKKSGKDKTPSRRVSPMEFMKDYEDSEPSEKDRKEARAAARTKSNLPGDRSTGYGKSGKSSYADMDQEDVDRSLKSMAVASSAIPAVRGASTAVKGLKLAKRRYDVGKRVLDMPENKQKIAFLKAAREAKEVDGFKSGGSVKSSASRRADGIAVRGKTKGRMV